MTFEISKFDLNKNSRYLEVHRELTVVALDDVACGTLDGLGSDAAHCEIKKSFCVLSPGIYFVLTSRK